MAAQKAIKTTYADGQTVWSNVRNNFGSPIFDNNQTITLTKVDTWYDGTPMSDDKVDGKVWLKMKTSEGGGYARVDLPNWGETFLEKNTMSQMRGLSLVEILLLKAGYYKGVGLSGYYQYGDTPGRIEYFLSNATGVDNGGSVIDVGNIKLEHDFTDYLHISYFGVMGKSDTEDVGLRIRNALQTGCSYIDFGSGKALSSIPLEVASSTKLLTGTDFELYYNKEQSSSPVNAESCISIISNDHFKSRGITVKYTGTFDLGNSYPGIISGFRISDSSFVTIDNCKAYGFNYTGLIVAGDKPYSSVPYCENVVIQNCDFSYNRVAGIYHGNTRNLKIIFNTLSNNGLSTDSGTGYGTAGMSTLSPINTLIQGNNTSYNVRKGIDLHSGKDSIIIGNFVKGNGLYGIAYDTNSEIGKVIISGNQISDMVIDGSKTPTAFTQGYPLYIGSYDGQTSWNENSNLIVSDNIITNCGVINGGNMTIMRLLVHGLKRTSLSIFNNKIDVNDITCFIEQRNTATRPGDYFDIDISHNTFKATSVSSNAFSMISPLCRSFNFDKNIIDIEQEYTLGVVVSISASIIPGWSKSITNNQLVLNKTTPWASYLPFTLIGNNQEYVSRNYQKGILLRDWNGFGFVDYGSEPPTSLTYFKNSIRYNTNMTANSPVGWTCVSNGTPGVWQEFGRSARMGGSSGQRPVSPILGQMFYSTTKGRPEWFNGTDWVDSDPNATTNVKGLVNQATASADTATQASGETPTKAEFDALLAELRDVKNKLRTAGTLAPNTP